MFVTSKTLASEATDSKVLTPCAFPALLIRSKPLPLMFHRRMLGQRRAAVLGGRAFAHILSMVGAGTRHTTATANQMLFLPHRFQRPRISGQFAGS